MGSAIATTGFACLGFTCTWLAYLGFACATLVRSGRCVRFCVGLNVRLYVCVVSLDVGFRVRCYVCLMMHCVRRYVRRNVYCVSVRRLCVQVSSVVFAVVVHHRFV